jgi:hypothetical protein
MIAAMTTAATPGSPTASNIKPAATIEQAFKSADNGNKGYLDQADVESAIVKLSPEGLKLSQDDAKALAKDAFSAMDQNQDGLVTQDEFKQSAESAVRPEGPRPSGRPAGAGSAGAQHGSGGGGSGATSASSAGSSAKNYDAADRNQDGTVSEAERVAYADKHAPPQADPAARVPSGAV